MRGARRWAVGMAALWLACATGVALAEVASLLEDHGRWRSGISVDLDDSRFKAVSAAVVDEAVLLLTFDRFPGSCERLYASLHVSLPRPSAQSMVMLDDIGYVRVDERPIHAIRFHARVREGESVVLLEITRVTGEEEFLAELRRGQTVRIKLGTARATYYAGFSLSGFSAAVDRTLALCRQNDRFARELAPSRQPKPRGKEDSDYFEE